MKKRTLSVLLAAVMAAGTLAACGGGSSAPAEKPAEKPAEEAAVEAPEESAEGSVFNVYCWNDEFQRRMRDHYPGYEEVDATHGKIGDVEVVWNITPSDNNAYQNNLDETLLKQADAAADEKIDLFLIEADYALKYVGTDYTIPVKDLGITDADLANQYKYTQDVVTDGNGDLKGVSWQGCPGVMIYSREAAKEVFGSDDPAEIQTKFSDWDAFVASAKELKDKGYQVVSSVNDTYRVYSNNVTTPWVVDGKINLDENIKKWVDDSKALVDAGYAGTHDLWLADWSQGFYPEGKVFAYFGPAWLIDFCMAADTEGSIANAGGWAATEGPQG
ncbi:MAG: carbohydrate ABC transporter substrate-binding protein, partial [bacterium]